MPLHLIVGLVRGVHCYRNVQLENSVEFVTGVCHSMCVKIVEHQAPIIKNFFNKEF